MAELTAARRNNLANDQFAYVDSDGNGHLPIHDAAHTRAAMARFNQTQFESAAAKRAAHAKIVAAAKRFGIDVGAFADVAKSADPEPAYEIKALPFALDGDLTENCFSGYLASFGNVDSTGDVILPGAFAGSLAAFVRDGTICWQHDLGEPIGRPIEAREDPRGLYLKAEIVDTHRGADALKLMRKGVVSKLSIGYLTKGSRFLDDDEGKALLGEAPYQKAMSNLPWGRHAVRALTDIELIEGSVVTHPANRAAVITAVKSSGLPAGLTFAEEVDTVLDAVEAITVRAKGIHDLRVKQGRTISGRNAGKLRDLISQLDALLDEMLGEPEESEPTPPKSDPIILTRLERDRFERHRAAAR